MLRLWMKKIKISPQPTVLEGTNCTYKSSTERNVSTSQLFEPSIISQVLGNLLPSSSMRPKALIQDNSFEKKGHNEHPYVEVGSERFQPRISWNKATGNTFVDILILHEMILA